MQDAPVECATLFHEKVMQFLDSCVLNQKHGKGGILGRVTHYVIRYEVQHRGSLHAHIILWVETDDIDKVAAEITAMIPADFDNDSMSFTDPTCPQQTTLKNLVLRKQIHQCGPVSNVPSYR